MTTITIHNAMNGCILTVKDNEEGDEEIVFQERYGNDEDSGEIECFADFLRFINEHFGPSTSRYSAKRIHITTEPGDKYIKPRENAPKK